MAETVKRYVVCGVPDRPIRVMDVVALDIPDWKWMAAKDGMYFFAEEVHERREDAIADAIGRRDRRIAELRREISRLVSMTFDDTPEIEGSDNG